MWMLYYCERWSSLSVHAFCSRRMCVHVVLQLQPSAAAHTGTCCDLFVTASVRLCRMLARAFFACKGMGMPGVDACYMWHPSQQSGQSIIKLET